MKLDEKVLIVGENDSDNGNIKVWSTNSEDEEVYKLTHGGYFLENKSKEEKGGRCFIVQMMKEEL